MGKPVSVVIKDDKADLAVFIALYPIPVLYKVVKYSITTLTGGENAFSLL